MKKKILKILLFLVLPNIGFSSYYYKKENNKIYFDEYGNGFNRNNEVKNVDYNSFAELKNYYAKDKNFGYWEGKKIQDSDGKTFNILPGGISHYIDKYAKDKNHVYYNGEILEGANPKTIERLIDDFLKDDKNVFFRNKKMKNVDVKTFQALDEEYAKDKNHIYYEENIIEDADTNTFEKFFDVEAEINHYIRIKYYRDKNNVYYKGKKLDVDRKTFEVLNEHFSKDKNHLYYNNRNAKEVDVKTFKIISQDSKKIYIFKDKNHLYNESSDVMENIDLKTFEILKNGKYKDKNGIYKYEANRLRIDFDSIDPKEYEKLSRAYTKYKNSIYWYDTKMENVDVKSFKVLYDNLSSYAKDKNHIYNGLETIGSGEIKNPETFEFLPNGIIYGTLYGKDKYNAYYIKSKQLNCFSEYHYVYKIKGINKDKIKVLNEWFIKDDKNIYFNGEILEGADYDTFEVLSSGEVKDKNRSYKDLIKQEEEKYYKTRSGWNIEDLGNKKK